ncbi:MAG: ferrous iron transport protein B [Syntrophaceae bacterium]|nr:ferrous iron transport protein B [Syntrophaceae bacterium]
MIDERQYPVTSLDEGEEGVIHLIAGGGSLLSRLAGMGIAPAVRIKVLRNSSNLFIVQVAETRIALGRGEAAKIIVRKVPKQPPETAKKHQQEEDTFLFALAGQPNVGKSTVFNILTGLSQHVGNWPGKTVEKKEGTHESGNAKARIVDLPGTYSLTSFSDEERVSRDFVLQEHPDAIILLMNAAAMERSLYLLSELLLLGPPVIAAVNMIDVADNQGIQIDIDALEKELGIPVVPMIATQNRGIDKLFTRAIDLVKGKIPYKPSVPAVSEDHRDVFLKLSDLITPYVPIRYPATWIVTKIMEGDPEILGMMIALTPQETWNEIQSELAAHEDSLRAVVGGRYDWIERITRAAVSRFKMGQVVMTDRIDHVLTRPIFGIPILLAILGLVFFFTYTIGAPLQALMEKGIQAITGVLEPMMTSFPTWSQRLILDGMIGGAGLVMTFLPILLIFFAAMAFLEDVGYMARAAFVMDRFMHLIGLHGKSFIPMCLGFGCNVPAILGSRIIESRKARLLTIFLAPFIPCTGRIAVLIFMASAIFAEKAPLISWSLMALNMIVLGLTGIVIKLTIFREESMLFIMELPLYHKPDIKTIAMAVWSSMVAFVKKAGTIILAMSMIIWIFSYLPHGNVETSFLAMAGHWIEPLGAPLGLDWKMITALFSSLVAKENSIATLGVLYGLGEEGIGPLLGRFMPPASALSFLVVQMLFLPCVATIGVMKQEMGNWKWFLSALSMTLLISFVGGAAAYRIALWLGL